MAKRTLILSQAQLDEICGGDSAYLDKLDSTPDMAPDFAGKITSDGGMDDGYANATTTDDIASDMVNHWLGLTRQHGLGPITVREWREIYLEEKEHGNARLNNVQFGAGNGEPGKSYDATKMALSRKRSAERTMVTGGTPEIKQKAANTVARMKNNWNGIDSAEKQYNSAKANDKTARANLPVGQKRKPKSSSNGLNGVFL